MSCSAGNASQRAGELQPETRALMDLIQERGFTLSVALDGGSLLVTYPYDKPVQPGMFWPMLYVGLDIMHIIFALVT